jgi:hypothetical protein
LTKQVYRELSDRAHHSRVGFAGEFNRTLRRYAYGPIDGPLRRVYWQIQADEILYDGCLSVGLMLTTCYGPKFWAEVVESALCAVRELQAREPLLPEDQIERARSLYLTDSQGPVALGAQLLSRGSERLGDPPAYARLGRRMLLLICARPQRQGVGAVARWRGVWCGWCARGRPAVPMEVKFGRGRCSFARLPVGAGRPRAKAQVLGLIPAALLGRLTALEMRAPVRRPHHLPVARPASRRPAAGS